MNGNKLPDFFMLGVQKAATSTFHKILNQDSDFSLPYKKETHFFSENFNKNLNWYLNQYNSRTYKIRGEIDPSYIYYKKTPQNIKKHITDPKFIIIFRKPIDRAYSHYLMSKSRGYENETFNKALDLENKRLENGSKFSFSHHSYLSRGLYHEQVEKYKNVFPDSKFLYLKYEDFLIINNREKILRKIYRFLNVKFKDNLNISFHENKSASMRFKFIRDLTHSDNILRTLLKNLIPSEYLRFIIISKINTLNKKNIVQRKLSYSTLNQKYIDWNNEQSYSLSKLCDLNIKNWII